MRKTLTMKQLLFFTAILGSLPAVAQEAVVGIENAHIVYEQVSNPISISLENTPCSQLKLATDVGYLQKGPGDCQYIFTTGKPGKAVFTLSKKAGSQYVEAGKITYLVKPLPLPEAMVAGKHGGAVPALIFKAQDGLIARLEGFDFPTQFKVSSFQMEVIRDGKVLLSTKNNDNIFEPVARTIITHVAPGDTVSFSSIMCRKPGDAEVELEPFSINITN